MVKMDWVSFALLFAFTLPAFGGRTLVRGPTAARTLKTTNLSFIPAQTILSTINRKQELSEACTLTFDDVSSAVLLNKEKKNGYYTTIQLAKKKLKLNIYIIEPGLFTSATLECTGTHATYDQIATRLKGIGKLYLKK